MLDPWPSIVQSLRERRLIPILGADAVRFAWHSRTAPLHEFMATLLLERLAEAGEAVPDPAPLGLAPLVRAIAALPQNAERDRDILKRTLRALLVEIHCELLREVQPAPETAALRLLRDAPLLVTTAIDAGLEWAFKHMGLSCLPLNVKRLTARTAEDLPEDWANGPSPLYYMLGRVQGDMTFALTDDELIESFWKLQGADAPRRLIETFAEKDVLFLGTGFPDWLLRFALRWARGRAYADHPLDSFALVAENHLRDDHTDRDTQLLGFLRQFQSGTWLYRDSHPAEFFSQLEAHVDIARAGVSVNLTRKKADTAGESRPNGHVFVSYSSEDEAFARRLTEALGRRCRVWFDQERLRGGEELRPELQAAIQRAHLVVPIISRHTNTAAGRRVFVEEWKCALRCAAGIQINLRPYIVPIVVGDLPYHELAGEATKFADRELGLTFRYARSQPPVDDDDAAAFERLIDDLHAQYQNVEAALHGLPVAS